MQVLQDVGVAGARHEVLPLGAVLLVHARRDRHEAARRVLADRRVGGLVVRLQGTAVHLRIACLTSGEQSDVM